MRRFMRWGKRWNKTRNVRVWNLLFDSFMVDIKPANNKVSHPLRGFFRPRLLRLVQAYI